MMTVFVIFSHLLLILSLFWTGFSSTEVLLHEYAKGQREDGEETDRGAQLGECGIYIYINTRVCVCTESVSQYDVNTHQGKKNVYMYIISIYIYTSCLQMSEYIWR